MLSCRIFILVTNYDNWKNFKYILLEFQNKKKMELNIPYVLQESSFIQFFPFKPHSADVIENLIEMSLSSGLHKRCWKFK